MDVEAASATLCDVFGGCEIPDSRDIDVLRFLWLAVSLRQGCGVRARTGLTVTLMATTSNDERAICH